MSQNTQAKNDAELNAIISESKKKAKNGTIVIVIGVVVMVLLFTFFSVVAVFAGIALIVIGMMMRSKAKSEIKECMIEAALLPALNEVFDNVEYSAEDHIPDSIIKNTDMGFGFQMDRISGSDYIKAEYKGVGIEMSDITIKSIQTTTDSDGHVTQTEVTEFMGLWLICDFHKSFTADLRLTERQGIFNRFSKNSVETENESFNKQFIIRSKNPHDVFYILTPHMMEYIQEMDRKADARSYMLFEKSGKLYLALDSRRDAFEINSVSDANAEDLREQFIDEVHYVVDLIDELRLVKTLHEVE